MAKPTSKPDWTVGNPSFGTVTIEPSAGKKQAGWGVGERPPAQFMNWLFFNIGEWIDYFESVTDQLLTIQGLYDAVVGTGGDFATLAAMVGDAGWAAGDYKNILIVSTQAIDAQINLDQDDVTIESKPGVNIVKGVGTTKGFFITGNRVRILKSRFANFNDGGDIAVEIDAAANYTMVHDNFFLDNDSDIVDNGNLSSISNNIDEV